MEKQEALLDSVRRGFEGVPIIVAESKNDILVRDNGNFNFSAETGSNMDELREMLLKELRKIRFEEDEEDE